MEKKKNRGTRTSSSSVLWLCFQVSHLEDIVEQTGYVLEKDSEYSQKMLEEEEEVSVSVTQKGGKTLQHQVRSSVRTVQRRCVVVVYVTRLCRIQEVIVRDSSSGWDLGPDLDHFSSRTRQVLQYMNPNKINMDLLVDLISYIGTTRPQASVRRHGRAASVS